MTKMHSGITETNPSRCRGKRHPRLCFIILPIRSQIGKYANLWILHCTWEILHTFLESMHTPNITNWIGALICRSQNRVLRPWNPFIIRNCCPRFEGVTKNVETGTRMNCGRHRSRIQRIDETECWLQRTMRNSCLYFRRSQVKDCLRSERLHALLIPFP
jgi:hypothetical protein